MGPAPGSTRERVLDLARGYAAGLLVVVVCILVSFAGASVLQIADRVLVFPLGVLIVAGRFGIGPAIFTAVTGVLSFAYLFLPPMMSFAVADTRHVLTLTLVLVVTAVISILTDRLRRHAEQARRQADIEALRNALLSSLSHDFKTPLAALGGAGAALYEDRLEASERRQLARMIMDESERLGRLLTNLLELTRLEAGRVTAARGPQAIDEVIGVVLRRLAPRLSGRKVLTDVPESVPMIAFDPVLIEQVLVNILENSITYAPDASPIDIAVRTERQRLIVEVSDRGPGVPTGEEERVFDKLYRGEPAVGSGSGLGLTICRAIIAAHEGRITFENRRGGGATVRFALPISRSAFDGGTPDEHEVVSCV